MPKLKTDPIEQADLIEFLDNHSDFSFELEVLQSLIGQGFECQHGGTYTDDVTKKPREFDIRAFRNFENGTSRLSLAVECKNIRPNFPLLFSCVPRREHEAFHQVVLSIDAERHAFRDDIPDPNVITAPRFYEAFRMVGKTTWYAEGEPVGKSCEQVGRTLNSEISATDSAIYDKWAQALSSAKDLAFQACHVGMHNSGNGFTSSLVFPLVVVPNDRLWVTQFDENGVRIADPAQVDRCSYFVDRFYRHESKVISGSLTISHLEFVTFRGLKSFVDSIIGSDQNLAKSFPDDLYNKINLNNP